VPRSTKSLNEARTKVAAKLHATPLMRVVWHGMMALDKKLPNIAVRVGIAIGKHFNNTTAETFVSQNKIAADIGVSPRFVRVGIRALKARGHLKARHGGRASNRYGMPLEKVAAECHLYLKKGGTNAPQNTGKVEPGVPLTLREDNSTTKGSPKMDEGKQAVFPTYSPQWRAWLQHHEATGNLRRADLMRHQAENGRWNTWAESTPYPPNSKQKQADSR
jgi:hypothetical protein